MMPFISAVRTLKFSTVFLGAVLVGAPSGTKERPARRVSLEFSSHWTEGTA